jgi:tRNA modification GTPase
VDALLRQPELWRAVDDEQSIDPDSCLRYLVHPPLVVAVGRANIGKSSLVNALAGSSVAMVSDHAGTTRDHLGVMLDLAGLVVRWVDTPGIDERVEVGDELRMLEPVISSADLVVHAIDHDDATGELDPRLSAHIADQTPIIRIGMRNDLGASQCLTDFQCSVKSGEGIDGVVRGIRDRLIDPAELSTPKAWRFW